MEFVNSIAKIVHMEVSLHGGAANKNIGDAFLLVWKFPRHTRLQAGNVRGPQHQQNQPPIQALPPPESSSSSVLASKCVSAFRQNLEIGCLLAGHAIYIS